MRNNGRNGINTPQRRFNSGAAQTETAHASNFLLIRQPRFFLFRGRIRPAGAERKTGFI